MKYLKKIYNFLASVKLAIPLMIILLICSALGTIYESKYNTEYANLVIYKTWWFLALLFLLFINILFATLTRLPWKKRHIGFLITHLGMLLLLVGSVLTMNFGIDGTMQIVEGGESNLVFLANNVLEIDRKIIPVKRYLNKYDVSQDKDINSTEFKFLSYLPFVESSEESFSKGENILFNIKSPFFDVTQVLNDQEKPEVQMGPATFRIAKDTPVIATKPANNPHSKTKSSPNSLDVLDKNGNLVLSINVQQKKKFQIENISFEIVRYFKNAQIVNNKIQEGDESNQNPAIEVFASQNDQKIRDILYQKIPTFTLHPNGLFGYNLKWNSGDPAIPTEAAQPSLPSNHPRIGSSNNNRMGNTVEFKKIDGSNNQVEISLYKENKLLDQKTLKLNQSIITPWMGIEITFKGLKSASAPNIPAETTLKEKQPLPPSALQFEAPNGEKQWIVENSEMQINTNKGASAIYYGRERQTLPFSLFLEKFEKKDYPGSEMPMSYKSYVKINSKGDTKEIYMNEPLKYEGFTFYQSSYQLNPNSPAITILSVNQDPGRVLKYLGSLIMCLGIVFYTFQKSQRFSRFFN